MLGAEPFTARSISSPTPVARRIRAWRSSYHKRKPRPTPPIRRQTEGWGAEARGTLEELPANSEWLDALLPVVRADFELWETYGEGNGINNRVAF